MGTSLNQNSPRFNHYLKLDTSNPDLSQDMSQYVSLNQTNQTNTRNSMVEINDTLRTHIHSDVDLLYDLKSKFNELSKKKSHTRCGSIEGLKTILK